ncbi:MAG: hypothetical protein EBT92_13820 [Planctomycetes bacterium]|nr:hypothetical protein [Planctomycetota bacterium]NBY01967.1 hypothetical protein [Planctomycetota bacterium]
MEGVLAMVFTVLSRIMGLKKNIDDVIKKRRRGMNGNKCENHGKYIFLEKSRKESGAHEVLEHWFHITTS